MAKPTAAVTKKEEDKAVVPSITFEADAGAGLENADRDSYAIPFLVVLQKGSPQCDKDSDLYVKGAEPGEFFNTATQRVYDGKKGVVLCPAHFERLFVEWVPRENGGGFRGSHQVETIDTSKLERDEAGRFKTKDGNNLVDTRYHYCLMIDDEGEIHPVVFALSSTQIKKSKLWLTAMSNLKLKNNAGKEYTPPTFSHLYRVTSVTEKNEKGSWKGIQVVPERILGTKKNDESIYISAREFKSQISSGKVKADTPPTGTEIGVDDGDY